MKNVLVPAAVLTLIASCGLLMLGDPEPAPVQINQARAIPEESAEQAQRRQEKQATEAAEKKAAEHTAQLAAWAARDKELAEALVQIEGSMAKLGDLPAQGEAWQALALETASQLNSQPQSDTLTMLKEKWRATPSVRRAVDAEVREKTAIVRKEAPKLLRAAQELYANKTDRALLDAGIEAEVVIGKGRKGAALRVKSALAGRVFADRLANGAGMYQGAESAGFSHLVFVNTIDESTVSYELSPRLDFGTSVLEREVRLKWAAAD